MDSPSSSSRTPIKPTTSSIPPSGPVCTYGSRLAFTYFPGRALGEDELNAADAHAHAPSPSTSTAATAGGGGGGNHFFTIDHELVYLSFYKDSGPLNIACV